MKNFALLCTFNCVSQNPVCKSTWLSQRVSSYLRLSFVVPLMDPFALSLLEAPWTCLLVFAFPQGEPKEQKQQQHFLLFLATLHLFGLLAIQGNISELVHQLKFRYSIHPFFLFFFFTLSTLFSLFIFGKQTLKVNIFCSLKVRVAQGNIKNISFFSFLFF